MFYLKGHFSLINYFSAGNIQTFRPGSPLLRFVEPSAKLIVDCSAMSDFVVLLKMQHSIVLMLNGETLKQGEAS
ncbi:Uncharacterised protein [BD1-7 clade bacterium]|uniref:Uncharacterized protein n=1 Tax=BD1-7 clade bacterium TaxID=2029982 RepID=A0A5S9PZA4_9GAMM|nr:Uncharacterised protein [BD1-7 clade bacterium]CAA0112891.1 Uncharacterised protein [BD1-7 clade bacterium]